MALRSEETQREKPLCLHHLRSGRSRHRRSNLFVLNREEISSNLWSSTEIVISSLICLNIQVLTHNARYGKTKQEFLTLNGPLIAQAKDVIYLLTEKSSRSTFTFHELTLAEWFEKPIVTAYIENVWTNMRSSIRALLGKIGCFSLLFNTHLRSSLADYPSVDFIRQLLHESLAILHTYLRPQVLSTEETPEYIQKFKQTVRPLASIAALKRHSQQKISPLADASKRAREERVKRRMDVCFLHLDDPDSSRFIYLSYSKINEKWNVNHAIERLIFVLEAHHLHTGIQVTTNTTSTSRENDPYVSSGSSRSRTKSFFVSLCRHHLPKIQQKSSSINHGDSYVDGYNPSLNTSVDVRHSLGPGDIRHCRAMIVCLTPKYFRNEHCLNELRLCEIYQKPVVVCLLRQMSNYRPHQSLNTSTNLDEQINMFIPPRLPITTLNFLRKNIRASSIDLTTNELFSRNAPMLIRRLHAILRKSPNALESPTQPVNPNTFSQTSEVFWNHRN